MSTVSDDFFVLLISCFKHPEDEQFFEIRLLNLTGGATLTEPTEAELNVLANDYPVTLSPSVKYLEEGSSFNFNIFLKNKTFNEDVVVSITAMPQSALINDFDAPDRNITIKAGESSAIYPVHIREDNIPEMMEQFYLILTASSGDTVLCSNFSSVVFILPNDDPGGIVQFSQHQTASVFKEGESAYIR